MRAALLACTFSVAVLVPAEVASACSCAPLKPKEKLRTSKAALTGKVVAKKLVSGRAPLRVFRYRVRVRKALKRGLGRHVSIQSGESSASCGFRWRKGQVVGAYLYGRPGKWQTNLCLLERPRVIRRLAREQDGQQSATSRGGPCRAARSAA
jgi:hypothetical protein